MSDYIKLLNSTVIHLIEYIHVLEASSSYKNLINV